MITYMFLRCSVACRMFGIFLIVLLWGQTVPAAVSVETIELPNQMVVLISEEHSLPFVTLNLLMDAGAWRDPPRKAGLANLTAESMLLGTEIRSVSEINEMLDYLGASLDVSCSFDYTVLSLKSLKKEFSRSFDLFLEILTGPSFPAEEIRQEKERILGIIASETDAPTRYAMKRFREAVYLDGPYSRPVKGTESTLSALDREDVSRFYRSFYQPKTAILSVVGDITAQEVRDNLLPRLSQWENAEIPDRSVDTQFASGPKMTKEDRPLSQANIVLGHRGIQRNAPDYYAVSVMNRILGGGGLASRLMKTVRIEKGLAYSVYSTFSARKYPGAFRVVLQTSNDSASEAIELVREEMKRIQQEPVSETELETAKKYLIGSFPLRLDTQASLAAFMTQVVYYELGLDYPERYPSLIRAVTSEDVLQAAEQHLYPDELIISIIGDIEAIETGAAAP
ncbi:MAG: pitrilysin family protein [Desulfobacterales bacterium]